MEKKSILRSKTFWFNIGMALLPAFTNHLEIRAIEYDQTFAGIWAFLSIALRMITKDKVVLLDK